MRRPLFALASLAVLQPAAATLGAQSLASFDSIAAHVAIESARFADRRLAVADGYRRVGTDFPGMGEHWLNPDVMMRGTIDAARPTLLIYATVNGKPMLLGVGFVAVTRGDSESTSLPGWPAAWHEHSGLLSDESGAGRHDTPSSGTHIWVSHVWTELENPNGRYAPDNWALPFARAGLRAPTGVDADAGRALSLVVGGDEYLRAVLADAGLRTTDNAGRVDHLIVLARRAVDSVVASARAAGDVRSSDLALLRERWQSLHAELRAELGPAVDSLLATPHARHATARDGRP
ncbi:MAG TPA: hypothetical protein VFS57_10905 [Gemmatimonadaceae bacterium]|nr:hypothetical protein [Gemmatimonadaceae bacterium]